MTYRGVKEKRIWINWSFLIGTEEYLRRSGKHVWSSHDFTKPTVVN